MRNAVTAASNCCKQMNNHPKALTVSINLYFVYFYFNKNYIINLLILLILLLFIKD